MRCDRCIVSVSRFSLSLSVTLFSASGCCVSSFCLCGLLSSTFLFFSSLLSCDVLRLFIAGFRRLLVAAPTVRDKEKALENADICAIEIPIHKDTWSSFGDSCLCGLGWLVIAAVTVLRILEGDCRCWNHYAEVSTRTMNTDGSLLSSGEKSSG